MNHSREPIPIVQVSTSWNGRGQVLAATTQSLRRQRAMISIVIGALIGLVLDVCFFDESLFALLEQLLSA